LPGLYNIQLFLRCEGLGKDARNRGEMKMCRTGSCPRRDFVITGVERVRHGNDSQICMRSLKRPNYPGTEA
jgi:hypothetical protein